MAIDISNVQFESVNAFHYERVSYRFKQHLVKKTGHLKGKRWNDFVGPQDCALRISVALMRGGVTNLSSFVRRNVQFKFYHEKRCEFYAIQALEFVEVPILANGKRVKGNPKRKREQIVGRKGIIYFGGTFNRASGHITLWNGENCHFKNEEYFHQPIVVFWELKR